MRADDFYHARLVAPLVSITYPVLRRIAFINFVMTWKDNIISSSAGIRELLSTVKTIAVLGIKTEAQASQPAFYVPRYLDSAGFRIIPVPVYYPEVTHILGQK